MNVIYGAVDGDGRDDHYYVKVNMENSTVGMGVVDDGNATWLDTAPEDPSFSTDTWYKLEIQWNDESPNTHDVTLYDQNSSSLASFSYDGTDSADPNFEGSGFGYSAYVSSSGETTYFDYAVTENSDSNSSSVWDGNGTFNVSENFATFTADSTFEFANTDSTTYRFDRGKSGASVVNGTNYSGGNVYGATFSGTHSLQLSENYTEMISTPDDGRPDLPRYPSAGDTFGTYFMPTGGADNFNLSWGVQGHDDRYYAKIKPESGSMYIFKYNNADGTVLGSTSGFSLSQDTWYYAKVDWEGVGSHRVGLYDLEGTKIAEATGTEDSTPQWSDGGIGYDAYLGTSESVYVDKFLVGERSESKGTWGKRKSSHEIEQTGSDDYNNYDFAYNTRYDGLVGKGYDSVSGEEFYEHRFAFGARFHTYQEAEEFTTSPSANKLTPISLLHYAVLDIEVKNNDSNVSGDFDYLFHNPDRTYGMGLTGTQWRNWVDANYAKPDTRPTVKREAKDHDVIDESDWEAFVDNLGFLFSVLGLAWKRAGTAGVLVGAASRLNQLTKDTECGIKSDPGRTSAKLTFDWCGDYPLIGYVTEFIVQVPVDDSINLVIKEKVNPNQSYIADNTGVFEVSIPGNGDPARLTDHYTE